MKPNPIYLRAAQRMARNPLPKYGPSGVIMYGNPGVDTTRERSLLWLINGGEWFGPRTRKTCDRIVFAMLFAAYSWRDFL